LIMQFPVDGQLEVLTTAGNTSTAPVVSCAHCVIRPVGRYTCHAEPLIPVGIPA
jgi:hypothetical protein